MTGSFKAPFMGEKHSMRADIELNPVNGWANPSRDYV